LQDRVEDLALHRSLYKDLSDEDWQWLLQQVEGYQRTRDKLPSLINWWFPPRISCEQCSSEHTARYKAALTPPSPLCKGDVVMRHLIDLTGGAGVDTYFMSEGFDSVDYVEQNEELCRLAQHNLPEKVTVHNCSAEEWLEDVRSQKSKVESQKSKVERSQTTIFIDPARRDKNGGKVFKLADCTPNVVELLPRMREVADTILIKLSPMLDISQALRELGGDWDVHVVAVKNEVKEVVLLTPPSPLCKGDVKMTAVDLAEGWTFEFMREEEENLKSDRYAVRSQTALLSEGVYLYEPSAAILKAGAYKLVGTRFGLEKLGVNTHLYVSEMLITNFPGRCWRILELLKSDRYAVRSQKSDSKQYNVLTRNYPLSAEQLKKKLKVKDGGEQYIIGTRIGEKPVVLVAERV